MITRYPTGGENGRCYPTCTSYVENKNIVIRTLKSGRGGKPKNTGVGGDRIATHIIFCYLYMRMTRYNVFNENDDGLLIESLVDMFLSL